MTTLAHPNKTLDTIQSHKAYTLCSTPSLKRIIRRTEGTFKLLGGSLVRHSSMDGIQSIRPSLERSISLTLQRLPEATSISRQA
jgi:hypothetical protein